LFEDKQCTIDFSQFTTFFGTALTIKNSLKLIGTTLGLQFSGLGGVIVFSVNSGGGLYLEVISDVESSILMQD